MVLYLLLLLLCQSHTPSNESLNNKVVIAELLSHKKIDSYESCKEHCNYYLATVNSDTILLVSKNEGSLIDTNFIAYDYNKKYIIRLYLCPTACCIDSIYEKSEKGVWFDLENNIFCYHGPFLKNDFEKDMLHIFEANSYTNGNMCYFYFTPDINGFFIRKECVIHE